MERNTDIGATVGVGSTSTAMLTRGQMARALREGAVVEARPGGTGGGVLATAISHVGIRKYINHKDLRIGGGCVTLAMLMAATITVAPTAGIPRNSANPTSSAPKVAGSIPRMPSPSVGDGNSVHPYVSDVNQGHQKKMLNKITGVTAAAVVGIAATVAGAGDLLVPGEYPTIQAAIDAAQSGDRVVVSPGVYKEQVNLSGKLISVQGAAGADSTVIDGEGIRTVVIGSDEPTGCEVSGFTIRNGNGGDAGGVSLNGSSARFHHCLFKANATSGLYGGAGFRSAGGASVVEDCQFVENMCATDPGSAGWYHFGSGTFTLRRCVFDSNTSNTSGGDLGYGGRVIVVNPEFSQGTGSIEGCLFVAQKSGVLDPAFWGSIVVHAARGVPILISDCRFIASSGGQLFAVWSEAGSSVAMVNCTGCGFEQPLLIWPDSYGTISGSSFEPICGDCNKNLTPDPEEIVHGDVSDTNQNNIPDTCECIGDIYLDGVINGADLGALLAYWGPTTSAAPSRACDLNADGVVNGSDLGILLAYWGPCSN